MRYDYNYNIGASSPGHGFFDVDAPHNVCWKRDNWRVYSGQEWNTKADGTGTNISQI